MTNRTSLAGRRRRLAAVAAAALLTLTTACSSSDDVAPDAAPAAAASSGAAPLKLVGILTVSAPSVGFPDQAAAIEAAVSAVNDSGGIAGRKVELTVCNDQADPNVSAKCAQDAVAQGAIAVIGGLSVGGSGMVPVLEQAGIPLLSHPINPLEFTSPASWPIPGGTPVSFSGAAIGLVKTYGCKKVDAITQSLPSSIASADFADAGLKSLGMKLNAKIAVPTTNADYGAPVAQVVSNGADCVVIALPPGEAGKAITALGAGAPGVKAGLAAASLTQALIDQVGKPAEGVLLSDSFLPVNSDEAGMVAFRDAMKKYQPDAKPTSAGVVVWSALAVVKAAAESIQGPIDGKAMQQALGTLDAVETGVGPAIDLTTPIGIKDFSRILNTNVVTYTVKDGTYGPAAEPFSVLDAVKANG
ncbi:ABC transporter substrate-binding protein [Nonomuraea ferruginea]|uniref:ABC transporter substrate-binding protein n=1 Tax=Nonomuraea ferruginea TaxID=46174 RepID=A0ABT4SYZ5_9ACTN|nr:ABC transporter substrate-binding protein [Nonomuraea ferruginea]MDA0642457.1 ABC transporter substrate-binding protein [Nonomuraea ferruginea]